MGITGLRLRHFAGSPGDFGRPLGELSRAILSRTCLLPAIVMIASAQSASADQHASRWDGDARSAVRLIAGSFPAQGTAPVRAGLEIRLKPGWHTYWRYPGDAGVPPRFDFSGSDNLGSVTVRWPAPRRISEEGLNVIGYDRSILLPVEIIPQERSKPVRLRLQLDYAVCEKLCVPAEGRAELLLSAGASPHDALIEAAERQVPKRVTIDAGGPLAVRSVKREQRDGQSHALVDVTAPPGAAVDVFAEGPTPEWSPPVPLPIDGAPPGLQRFAFALDGAPPGASYEGALITLTVVSGGNAVEALTRLD